MRPKASICLAAIAQVFTAQVFTARVFTAQVFTAHVVIASVFTVAPVTVLGQADTPLISIATSADGESIVQGTVLTISWQTGNAPPGSAVALFPQKAMTGHVLDPIATALPTSGRHAWQVPIFVMQPAPCAPDMTGGCVGSMNPGTTYKIIARLYTPRDADIVEHGPTKTHPRYIAAADSATFTMLAAP
jgi:hypothetical protein